MKLNRLSVLPSWRHIGLRQKKLLDFCKEKVRELRGNKIILDLIEENTVLKNWYAANGFVHTGTKSSRICRLRRVIWSGRQRNELHIPKSHARGCSLSHYLYKTPYLPRISILYENLRVGRVSIWNKPLPN